MNSLYKEPKKNYGYVYKYTSPSSKSYIGQTIHSLIERSGLNGYKYKTCPIFFSAIKKYGFNNFKVEILGEYPLSELDKWEQYWIEYYDSYKKGYNATFGEHSEPIKRKKKGKKIDQYNIKGEYIKTFNSLAEAAGEIDSTYQAISAVLANIRPQHKGFIYRYEGQQPPQPINIQKHNRLIGQYTLDNEFITTHSSSVEAAFKIGKNKNAARNIRAVCTGDRNSAYGFKWKYLD